MNSTEMNERKYPSSSGKMKIYLAYSILTTIFVLSMYKAAKDKKVTAPLIATSLFIMIFVTCDFLLHLCQVLVLLTENSSDEDITSILNRYLIPNITTLVVVASAALLLLVQMITSQTCCPLHYVWDCGPYVCTLSMIFSFMLLKLVTSEWKINSSPVFNDLKGLDYGTGMAYSYYYGYLRIILPSTGTSSKGIVEKIENFEDKHGITFPVHKLFILIPSSGYIPPDLKEASNQWMEKAQELEEETRNRAGVISRTYRSNAYKIYPGGQKPGVNPVYVVVEGATPLLTFYEVQNRHHAETIIYRKFKHEIISIFHAKLHNILHSELDMKDLCELIYYNDYDSNGTKVNVAKIILERISKLTYST